MFEAFSHPPDELSIHSGYLGYRYGGEPKTGSVMVKSKIRGIVNTNGKRKRTSTFSIKYTIHGDRGPIVLFLHGVPSNRSSYLEIQSRLSHFCRTVAIDMLGMGESSMPMNYGKDQDMVDLGYPEGTKPWDWITDVDIIDQVMRQLYGNEKFIFFADDWGAGQCMHYAAKYNNKRLLAMCLLDPIAFDGYPVSEIQAIGRASVLDDKTFKLAMGNIDQVMVQIFKTMVHNPDKVFNQYSLRSLKKTYIDVDYDRSPPESDEYASTMTLRLKWDNIRVLADRASILSPSLLLPYCGKNNPRGVKFSNITVPTLVEWGQYDNMMPVAQVHRFAHVLSNSRVDIQIIPDAGHFAILDNPDAVASSLINFIQRELGHEVLEDVFMGFGHIWKGDENDVIEDLRELYGKSL